MADSATDALPGGRRIPRSPGGDLLAAGGRRRRLGRTCRAFVAAAKVKLRMLRH